jgi:hypothetical protein
VTVGAYAERPKQWARFTKEWNAAKRSAGIKIYHAVDCANGFGEFKGWEKEACNEFSKKMLPIVAKHPRIGMVVGIDMKAFEAAMEPRPHLRSMAGTPYACCFQWVVQNLLEVIEKYESNEHLAFFHEQNDYQQEALASFDWVVKNRKKHTGGMTLAFGSKEDYVPLQAADVLAYEGSKRMQGVDAGRAPRRAWTALDPEQSRLTVKRYGKANMHLLVERLELSAEQIKMFGHVF